jgi:hypothetical protein
MSTPRQVVAAAFDALRANDWKALASLCDPLSLDAFKIEMLEQFGDRFGEPDLEIDSTELEPIHLDDEMYAEYMKYLHPDSMMKVEFPMLSTMDELRSLEPVDAFACWLEGKANFGKTPKADSDEAWIAELKAEFEDDSFNDGDWPRYEIVGCVFDSPEIAHVVYRPQASAQEVIGARYDEWLSRAPVEYRDYMTAMKHRGIPMLISCRRQKDGSWRLVGNRQFSFFSSIQVTEFRRDDM